MPIKLNPNEHLLFQYNPDCSCEQCSCDRASVGEKRECECITCDCEICHDKEELEVLIDMYTSRKNPDEK